MKISMKAFVSDMRCRWCHVHTAVAIYRSHWMHCRPFCCTKHENKPKMTADTMASQLWIMMLCSVRRHSCQMHMWVTSCHIIYAQAQHVVWTHTLSLRATFYPDVHVTLSVYVCLHLTYFVATLCWENIQMNVSAYTVVQVRDVCQLSLWCKWEMRVSLHCGASERRVSFHCDASERRVSLHCDASERRVSLHCGASERRVSLHCGASERRVSFHCGASERRVTFTVVQVRDMCQLSLWCKCETCVNFHCGASERRVSLHCGARPHSSHHTYSPSHLSLWNINHTQRESVIRD
jgi:hypothetical protein